MRNLKAENARSGIFLHSGAGFLVPCACLCAVAHTFILKTRQNDARSAALQGEDAAPSEQHDPTGPWRFRVHLFCFSTGKRIGPYSLNTK